MKAKYYVKQKMNNQLYKTNNNFSHSLSLSHQIPCWILLYLSGERLSKSKNF